MSNTCTECPNCNLSGHTGGQCNITVRKKRTFKRRLKPISRGAPHTGRQNFWDGVLTRTQLAENAKGLQEKIKKLEGEKKELEKKHQDLAKKQQMQEANTDICVICQDKCLEADENRTECGHVFHTGCLMGWLKTNNTCPCCRTELYEKPTVPDQSQMERVVEEVFAMHLNIDPTENTEVTLNSLLLYNLGDEVARLSVEQSLDVDLNWFIDFDNEEEDNNDDEDNHEDNEDNEQEDMSEQTVIEIIDSSSDMEIDYDNMEEKRGENIFSPIPLDQINTPTTPNTININLDLPLTPPGNMRWLEPQTMLDPGTTLFDEWIKYGNVLHELVNRNRFMRAWNAIDNASQSSAPHTPPQQTPPPHTPPPSPPHTPPPQTPHSHTPPIEVTESESIFLV